MLGGLVFVPIVSVLTKKTLPKSVDKIFTCYDTKQNVDITEHLGK